MPAISQAFRCFDEVARRGSVRKAAETLHLTAAAVNQQVLNLEAQVGTPLFDRLPRGMQLTAAGEIMIAAVRRSQRDYDNALTQVEDMRALRRGHVNIGVSHSTAESLLPQVVQSVQRSHPGITFSVRSGNGESLLRGVANGEIDVAYCLRRTPPPGVEEVRAHPQQLGVVMAPGHPLHTPARLLRLRDCLDHPLVMMSPDMELRSLLERIDPRLARAGRPLVETSSVPMVRRLVAGSQAVSFLLPDNVVEDVDAGRLVWVALEDAAARLFSGIYQRSGYTTSVAMGLLLGALEAEVNAIHQRFDRQAPPPLQGFAT
ncbi:MULTISPECIES: LysR family transcriptional regulator [Hydrogenophaga]|uniref:Transcriptional regulator n=1 Tax=Hydrogenophaga electricum TaxID=1230953 RepID=A0ABQ6CC24_9BURK|nr:MULTISPECIES: LysR family transcriptional regulator [Hydrogenophaga]GLS16360.1 transcriptional regulator [Hydrogenophaga electricum]